MAWPPKFSILLSIYFVFGSTIVTSDEDNFLLCESTVRNWRDSSIQNGVGDDKLTLKDLLFFLHVPRTGGRTYFHCFLRKLYPSSQDCPRSYDKLRFDPSNPNCRLVVTHDDYSLMSKLPEEKTSVITILRKPIDRVFSTYEFAIEVAARFLVHPNLTSATQMSGRIRPKSHVVSTLDIWPWKYLVPWMREDLFARRNARRLGEVSRIQDLSNPYNMEDIVMPLQVFIDDPVAHEIVHNGATFQVAGITNNSFSPESHEVRHCVRKYPELGQYILEVAKNRLDRMLYVGLTEDHKKSATMFANMVGAQVLSQSEASSYHDQQDRSNKIDLNTSYIDSEADGPNQIQHSAGVPLTGDVASLSDIDTPRENMTVGKLMDAYEDCVVTLRRSQTARRTVSLRRITPANFSREARLMVPEAILHQIMSLNSLDVELYKYAEGLFMQQKRLLTQNPQDISAVQQKHPLVETERPRIMYLYGFSSWEPLLLGVSALLIIVLFLVVTAKRRTSKLKV